MPEILGGHYRLGARIGRGGFGQVFEARDEVLDRRVALKLVPLPSGAEARLDALSTEAKTLARLDHPHIVPVYAANLEAGFMWMALKRIEGEDLRQLLERQGRMEIGDALQVLRTTLEALSHAHASGVVHRDLKPRNILVERTQSGKLHTWLTDFGLAATFLGKGETESRARPGGTPGYMAPEAFSGRPVGAPADLFAVGCLAIELLTGQKAFGGRDLDAIRHAIVHEEPRGLDTVAERTDPDFAELLRYLVAKSPLDRCPSAEDALRRLGRWSHEGPVGKTNPLTRALTRWRHFRARRSEPWDGRWAVEAEGIRHGYKLFSPVLRGLDLRVSAGSVLGIVGRNGAGKTTLIRTLAGLYSPSKGRVRVLGRDPWKQRMEVLPRLGYVPETPTLPTYLATSALLDLLRALHTHWDPAFVNRLLDRFELPPKKRISDLSRGQQTQLHLVAALGFRPDLLLLDDPTLGLDIVILEGFFSVLAELIEEARVTLIIASHNHADFEDLYTHVALLDSGTIPHHEPLDALRDRVRRVKLAFPGRPPDFRETASFHVEEMAGTEVTGVLVGAGSKPLDELRLYEPASLHVEAMTLRDILLHLAKHEKRNGE